MRTTTLILFNCLLLDDPADPDDTLINIKLTGMPIRGQLLYNDRPLESVYSIDFNDSSLSDWETLGDVSIRPIDSQSYGTSVGFDVSDAESPFVQLSTDSSHSVTENF